MKVVQSFVAPKVDTIWDDMEPADIDPAIIEGLFENRNKEVNPSGTNKKLSSAMNQVTVLDQKRSNAINIGMTRLPPTKVIKSAVLKMDKTVMNKESVEKILTMLPSKEEICQIEDAFEGFNLNMSSKW